MLKNLCLALVLGSTLVFSTARADNIAYVVNSYPGDETLSKINLTTGEVVNNFLNLGVSPNQIVIKGDYAYVVNSLDHDIQIINLKTESTAGYINIGEPRSPYHMAFADSQFAYVTNWATNTISKFDIKNQTVTGEYGVGRAPEGILAVGNKLYICCSGFSWPKTGGFYRQEFIFDSVQRTENFKALSYIPGRVYVFDLETETVVDSILVGLNPQYLDLDPEGELNVVCTGDYGSVTGKVYRINTRTNTVIDSIVTGGTPGVISISADGIGYLTAVGWTPDPGLIYSFNSIADTMIYGQENPITTDSGVIAVTVLFHSKVLSCNYQSDDVTLLDSSGTLIQRYLVGNGPISLALYPPWIEGDCNGDGVLSVSDVIYLINYLFTGGFLPKFTASADANCDGNVGVSDVVYLINYLFKGGPKPGC